MKLKMILFLFMVILMSGCSNLAVSVSQELPLDADNDSVVVTQKLAAYTLEGHTFEYFNYWTGITSLDTREILLYTGNTTHFLRQALVSSSANPVRLAIYESPINISNNGTSQTVQNRDRILLHNATMKVYYNPTYTSKGTNLTTHVSLGTKQDGGLCGQDVCTWILKNNTYYLIEMENLNGNGVSFDFHLLWTERH